MGEMKRTIQKRNYVWAAVIATTIILVNPGYSPALEPPTKIQTPDAKSLYEDFLEKYPSDQDRRFAIEDITDQNLLVEIALNDKYCWARDEAVKKMTDQKILAKIADEDKNLRVCLSAVSNITDLKLLEKFAADGRKNKELRWQASYTADMLDDLTSEIDNGHPLLKLRKTVKELADLKHWGDRVKVNISPNVTDKHYGDLSVRTYTVTGRDIEVSIKWTDGTEKPVREVKAKWESSFPSVVEIAYFEEDGFLAPETPISDIIIKFFNEVQFTQAELAVLTENKYAPELWHAAVGRLKDQSLLAKIAVENQDPSVRKEAAGKITDQTRLTEVALATKDFAVSEEAIKKITDQSLLARIGTETKNFFSRIHAFKKMTDQRLLAKIVLEDKDSDDRKGALDRLTDQSLLEKIAVDAEDPEIGRLASVKITDPNILAQLSADKKRRDDFIFKTKLLKAVPIFILAIGVLGVILKFSRKKK